MLTCFLAIGASFGLTVLNVLLACFLGGVKRCPLCRTFFTDVRLNRTRCESCERLLAYFRLNW